MREPVVFQSIHRGARACATLATLATLALLATSAARAGVVERPAPRASVAVRLFAFQPDTLRVAAGTRVVWANGDEIEHTVTSGAPGHADGRFALRLASAGDSAAVTLDRPGTYAYFCERHPSMRGALVVTRTGASTP